MHINFVVNLCNFSLFYSNCPKIIRFNAHTFAHMLMPTDFTPWMLEAPQHASKQLQARICSEVNLILELSILTVEILLIDHSP